MITETLNENYEGLQDLKLLNLAKISFEDEKIFYNN